MSPPTAEKAEKLREKVKFTLYLFLFFCYNIMRYVFLQPSAPWDGEEGRDVP